MKKAKSLVHTKIGRWFVNSEAPILKSGKRIYNCTCDCGTRKMVRQDGLRSRNSLSCGCLSREINIEKNTTHGMTKTPEYVAWKNMKSRCSNPNAKSYHRYGGRGINVCERWLESFDNFIQDMGKKSSKKHTLERVDGDGDYCPENCEWVTMRAQAYNTSRINENLPVGSFFINQRYRVAIHIDGSAQRLGTYRTKEEAARAYDDKCEEIGEPRHNQASGWY